MARPDYDFDLLNYLREVVQQLASDYGLREDQLWPEVCALEEEIRPSRSFARQAGARRAQLQWRAAEVEKVRGLLQVEDDFPTAISETVEVLQRTVHACVVKLCALGAVCRSCGEPLDTRDDTNPVVVGPEGLLHRGCADDEDEDTIAAVAQGGPRIAIVGGGLSGLVCADRLQSKGYRATIYEARTRLGGRCFSNRELVPGMACENGGEFIDTGHKTTQAYANEFGLARESVVKQAGEQRFFFFGRHWDEADVVDQFRAVAADMQDDLRRISGAATFYQKNDADIELDHLDLATYFATRCADHPLVEAVLNEAYVAEYGRETSEQSTLNFLGFMRLNRQSKFEPFGVSDERFHLVDGNDGIVAGLEEKLRGPIVKGARLVRLARGVSGEFLLYPRWRPRPREGRRRRARHPVHGAARCPARHLSQPVTGQASRDSEPWLRHQRENHGGLHRAGVGDAVQRERRRAERPAQSPEQLGDESRQRVLVRDPDRLCKRSARRSAADGYPPRAATGRGVPGRSRSGLPRRERGGRALDERLRGAPGALAVGPLRARVLHVSTPRDSSRPLQGSRPSPPGCSSSPANTPTRSTRGRDTWKAPASRACARPTRCSPM